MLKQWIDKLKNLFETEEKIDEEQSHERKLEGRQEIQAKMTYQYPEKRSFPFPVIPDQNDTSKPTENKVEEIPAYVRKTEEKQNTVPQRKTNRELTRTNTTRKIYKDENAPPFQLTEVPSPIYGLQKRKRTKEIENVPAYVRKEKEQREEKRETYASSETKRTPKEETNLHTPIPEAKPETSEEDKQRELASSKRADEEVMQQPEEKIRETQHSPRQANDREQRTRERNEKKRKRQRNRKGKNRSKSTVPFNVIMTPKDRQAIQPKQHVQKESKLETAATRQDENTIITDTRKPIDIHVPIHLLNDPEAEDPRFDDWIINQQELLEKTLKHFHVNAKVVHATQGPSVTRFEVQPELGVKVSKIRNLSDDLKLNMAAKDIRIEAPIPGKNTVGIEVPNPEAQMVALQEVLATDEFKNNKSPLTIALGVTIEGEPKITNIQKMPHGLIAGATGSGKSVCINSILLSIIYKASHEDVKFLLIDPKMVELAPYNGIPHLVSPVITDVKAATQSLKWAVNEMEERYERFLKEGVRDIERYNEKVIREGRAEEKMPYIVIVIDELADLMMMSPQDVESSISRIAQKARASGMHLLLATQRPSVDVITGLIKANIPTRIAFSVSSQVDSRTILDTSGAEKLLGKGDMLFAENGTSNTIRLQGPFVSDEEIERITAYARQVAEPDYLFEQEELLEQIEMEEDEDELLEDVIQFVIREQSASTSMVQRHFKIGYNRAARLIDTMEARGIITGQNGSKPRDVLVTEGSLE